MFYLYGNLAGWKELDKSKDEIDIINSIEIYKKGNTHSDFLVIDRHPYMDLVHRCIQSDKDFEEYKAEFNQKQKVLVKRKGN